MKQTHRPVLQSQVIEYLSPQKGDSYLDATAGYGGHAIQVLTKIGPEGRAILIDRDQNAVNFLQKKNSGENIEIIQSDFLAATKKLQDRGEGFDIILLDLGVSSPQLDNEVRGFSFRSDIRPDMRMDQTGQLSAYEVVNDYSLKKLEYVIKAYGEEPRARKIAQSIVKSRPITSNVELANAVAKATKGTKKIHPATRTFQAIRIEVNDEINQLEKTLPIVADLLRPNGRLVIVSFHSLEDRVVKQQINRLTKNCICPLEQPICTCNKKANFCKITKKVVKGALLDINNPRARSAKLRAIRKLT